MKEIIIKVPDSFSEQQVEFIKNSAMNQIAAEMRATLKVPQSEIDAVDTEIELLKAANVQEVVEPIEEPKEA